MDLGATETGRTAVPGSHSAYSKTDSELDQLSQRTAYSGQLSQLFPDVLYRNLISFQLCLLQGFLVDLFCLCISF